MITGLDLLNKLRTVDEPEHCQVLVYLAVPGLRGVVRKVPVTSAHLFADITGHVLELAVPGEWSKIDD